MVFVKTEAEFNKLRGELDEYLSVNGLGHVRGAVGSWAILPLVTMGVRVYRVFFVFLSFPVVMIITGIGTFKQGVVFCQGGMGILLLRQDLVPYAFRCEGEQPHRTLFSHFQGTPFQVLALFFSRLHSFSVGLFSIRIWKAASTVALTRWW